MQTSEDEYLSAEETSTKGNENEGGLSESFRKGCSIGGAGRGVGKGAQAEVYNFILSIWESV